jgi:hypothetical protein
MRRGDQIFRGTDEGPTYGHSHSAVVTSAHSDIHGRCVSCCSFAVIHRGRAGRSRRPCRRRVRHGVSTNQNGLRSLYKAQKVRGIPYQSKSGDPRADLLKSLHSWLLVPVLTFSTGLTPSRRSHSFASRLCSPPTDPLTRPPYDTSHSECLPSARTVAITLKA